MLFEGIVANQGRKRDKGFVVQAEWLRGERIQAWNELWRQILAEVLPGEHVVTVHDHTREKSQTDEYTREPDRDK